MCIDKCGGVLDRIFSCELSCFRELLLPGTLGGHVVPVGGASAHRDRGTPPEQQGTVSWIGGRQVPSGGWVSIQFHWISGQFGYWPQTAGPPGSRATMSEKLVAIISTNDFLISVLMPLTVEIPCAAKVVDNSNIEVGAIPSVEQAQRCHQCEFPQGSLGSDERRFR